MSETSPDLMRDGTIIGMTGLLIVTLGTDVLTAEQTMGVAAMLLVAALVSILGSMAITFGLLGSNDPPEVAADG